jgi:hypothetical protein
MMRGAKITTLQRRLAFVGGLLAVACLAGVLCSPAFAAGAPGWSLYSAHFPTNYTPPSGATPGTGTWLLTPVNVGTAAANGTTTVTVSLPAGLSATKIGGEGGWSCTVATLTCTSTRAWAAGFFTDSIGVTVDVAEAAVAASPVTLHATLSGGGAASSASASESVPIGSATPLFGIQAFSANVLDSTGANYTQAGGHPAVQITSFTLNTKPPGEAFGGGVGEPDPIAAAKTVTVNLPPGFVGNPQATPQCTLGAFDVVSGTTDETACPADSQVGVATVRQGAASDSQQTNVLVYNLVPQAGYPAEFGFAPFGVPTVLFGAVRSGSDYGVTIKVPNLVRDSVTGGTVMFWGTPAHYNGGGGPELPFLTNPTDCAGEAINPPTTTIGMTSWEGPSVASATAASPPVTGCELLAFNPSLSALPSPTAEGGSTQADEPSGYTVNLTVPQSESTNELATPELKDSTVTLPAGVSVSPSAADGLLGCQETGAEGINLTEEQINGAGHEDGELHAVPGRCPAASTLGTVEVFTPLLPDGPDESAPLQGHIYLAQPKCGNAGQPACTQASATNGELYGLYLEVEGSGVILKLKGSGSANPVNGQLTASFTENPQLPFNDLKLHFNGGPRAPFANPAWCAAATTTSSLSAWSEGAGGTPLATPSSIFQVDFNGAGGACPSSMPFSPSLSAGTTSVAAGAFTPFTLTFTRGDRQQTLSQIAVTTPAGLLGMVSKVPQCPEAQANAGSCSAASQIGTTTVGSGPGSHPFYVSGQVYLTGPYKGAPFGLSIVVPANAGPFHLGNVIVRAAISVNPSTAVLSITSDPLPQIIDGVPLRLQSVNVTVNRPEFMLNPTDCTASSVSATLTGDQGARAGVTSPFDVGGCASLPFKPRFSASTAGKASKADGASLDVKIESAGVGQANIAKVDLQLPTALPSRLSTLQKACLAAVFNANPAACEEDSVIGKATIHTPILKAPLTGPAYLVSHGGAAFPDVEFVLQGEGVTLILDGKTDIKNGITYSRFESAPDAPFTAFETELPTGPHSILAAYLPASAKYNLCGTSLAIPTIITAQNGKQMKQTTKIAVTGCGPSVTITKVKVSGNSLLVTVKTSATGRVRLSGYGLITKVVNSLKGGAHTITVALTKSGIAMRKHGQKAKVRVSLTVGKQAAAKTTSVKL